MLASLGTVVLASLLAGGAVAVPVIIGSSQKSHRALAEESPEQVIIDAFTVAADVRAATTTDASGNKALYFHAIKFAIPSRDEPEKCGEVNAAPYMPAEMFEAQNFPALLAYAQVTLDLYVNPNPRAAPNLKLGRCSPLGYTVRENDDVDNVSWFGAMTAAGPIGTSLMVQTCAARCQCSWPGSQSGLPACTDVPDDPAAGSWCSLCGPSTACTGCTGSNRNGVTIRMFRQPPTLPNIVQAAVATPDLSTLVAAVQAAGLVDTLSGEGPFTVFAPTNEAFAEIQDVVDQLLLPSNQPLLIQVLTFHVLASKVLAEAITNGESVATVEGQDICFEVIQHTGGSSAAWRAGVDISVFPCGSTTRKSTVTTPNVLASNGVVHIIDQVLVPAGIIGCPGLACPKPVTLFRCQGADGQCVETQSGGIPRASCEQICPGPEPELWFRTVQAEPFPSRGLRCGEVDAAPRMPAALFAPDNVVELQAYIAVTKDNYPLELELGRCQEIGYTEPAGRNQRVGWDDSAIMNDICLVQCECRYNLGYCRGLTDGQPAAGSFCSLCNQATDGSSFNSLATVDFYLQPASNGGH
jgi:uncharacterized surface protein with fasciclin (FAS1) repeats